MSKVFCLFLIFVFLSFEGFSATEIPKQLSESNRLEALKILGLGTAAKILTNPYPLGGHEGLEVGLSSEYLQVGDLSRLGAGTNSGSELNFYSLSLTKGTYYNLDTAISFTLFNQEENVSTYNGQVRWGFYQAEFLPLSFGIHVYGGGTNFDDLIFTQTLGVDLVSSISVDDVTLYFGSGVVRSWGTFVGGANGVTKANPGQTSGITEGATVFETHSVLGLNVDFSKLFFAIQVDRYYLPVYSFKLGYRF
ncbi:MAG: hypothetical protein ACOYOK_09400 [Pseudobdellovibrionaceae bacterium]